jgi:hypothetical protein
MCTRSIWAWQVVQVEATLSRWIVDLGSVCGTMSCEVWHDVQTAVTVKP